MARLVPEGAVEWPSDEPRLLGGRCAGCSTTTFPKQDTCPRCTGDDVDVVPLSRTGTLWTWTIQGFPPKSPPFAVPLDPATFDPYGVGYVELPGEVRVESRLTVADPEQLRIGMPVELVVVPFAKDGDEDLLTFAFAPVPEEAS